MSPIGTDVAYVLSRDPALATSTAVELLDRLPDTSRIVVRHGRDAGLARVFEQGDDQECGRVQVFSAYEDTCGDPDLILGSRYESLARKLHTLYLSDNGLAEPTWDQLEEVFREANRDQAEWIHRTLQDAGFRVRLQAAGRPEPPLVLSPEEVERMSRVEHQRWSAEKLISGWTFGAIKDSAAKTHPDLVPWSELPDPEREKDRQFVRRWPELLAQVGYAVQRG